MLENLSLREILWLSNFIFQMPLQVRTGIRCILNFHLPSSASVAWQGSDEKQKSRLSMKEENGSRWPLNSQLIISYFKKINLYFHSRYSVWGFCEMSPRRVALRLKEKWNKCPAPRLLLSVQCLIFTIFDGNLFYRLDTDYSTCCFNQCASPFGVTKLLKGALVPLVWHFIINLQRPFQVKNAIWDRGSTAPGFKSYQHNSFWTILDHPVTFWTSWAS